MLKTNITSLTKKQITKQIYNKTGLSKQYSEEIVEDLLYILKTLIKIEKFSVKNFGFFKILNKKERIGRNPKTKEKIMISSRKSLSFVASKNFNISDIE